MPRYLLIPFLLVAVLSTAIADILLKRIGAEHDSLLGALRHPLMIPVVALYAFQIAGYLYLFVRRTDLSMLGVLQTALYALVVVGSGILFFNESVSLVQGIGIALTMAGVILINF